MKHRANTVKMTGNIKTVQGFINIILIATEWKPRGNKIPSILQLISQIPVFYMSDIKSVIFL